MIWYFSELRLNNKIHFFMEIVIICYVLNMDDLYQGFQNVMITL